MESTGPPAQVLIVDDEPDVRLMVRRRLSRCEGFDVAAEASDGSDAVTVAAAVQPDVILLDLMMQTPGQQALPHLLAVAPMAMIAVHTALSAADHRADLLRLGAFAYYEKRDIDRLCQRLHRDYGRFRGILAGVDGVPAWLAEGIPVGSPR